MQKTGFLMIKIVRFYFYRNQKKEIDDLKFESIIFFTQISLWRVALFVIIVMQSSLFTMINYAKSSIKCSPALSREELETSKGQNTDRNLKLDERMIRKISRNNGFPVFFVQIFHYFANQLLLRSRLRIPAAGYVFLVFELEIDSLEGSHRVFFAQTAEFD